MGKRRKYAEEFRREAVRVVENRGERSVREVAEGLGIGEGLLHSWRKKYATTVAEVRAQRGETPDEELRRLRREVAQLKRVWDDALFVTPGIRPSGASADDQKRVSTPSAAIERGAGLLVIGRPIRCADDPVAAFDKIANSPLA